MAIKISDAELKRRCHDAIRRNETRENLFFQLKAERRKIGHGRLARVWEDCGGSVLAKYDSSGKSD